MQFSEVEEQSLVNEPDYSGTYTAADYLKWTYEGLYELIRGKVYKMSPAPTSGHQRLCVGLVGNLFQIFKGHPCEVFVSPFDVYLVQFGQDFNSAKNIVEPDICIVCDRSKIIKQGCVGAPDLVIEILSKSTSRKDLSLKFDLYEEFGVKEYWIVHPLDQTVIINVLENGKYRTKKPLARGEILQSELFPILNIDSEEIFQPLD